MITRREWLQITAGAGAALGLTPELLHALLQGQVIQREIPSTGERIPVIGLGSANTFSNLARTPEAEALKLVLKTLVERGGKVLDTAPSYGASELVAGDLVNELGLADKIFWATKVNVARGGTADAAAARAQIESSFAKFKRPSIDLIQVHNLGDVPTQLGILKALKAEKKIRYIGVTTTSDNQYPSLEAIMRNEPIDFIGLDYAVNNRNVEATILPLARERKIAVMVYLPFGRNSLWQLTAGKTVPDWGTEFDAKTWAQFFLKYVVSHPAVTVATPGTSKPEHMIDNLGGGMGKLPTEAQRQRMASYIDSLSR